MRTVIDALGDLLLGARCPGCGAATWGLCRNCQRVLDAESPVVSYIENIPVLAGGAYSGVLRQVILTAKERQGLALLPVLGQALARALIPLVTVTSVVLVPIPTAAKRIQTRGCDLPYDVTRLAEKILRRAGYQLQVIPGIVLARIPSDQSQLGAEARAANVAFSMRWKSNRYPSEVVIVDDLVTTGATLGEAIRACAAAKVQVSAAVCLARPKWK